MIISCPACGVKYRVDQETLVGSQKKIKCKKCGHVFPVHSPETEETHLSSEEGGAIPEQETTKVVKTDDILPEQGPAFTESGLRFSLAILSGPLAGQVIPIQKRVTLIGRAYGDIMLQDSEVSRKHCQVEIRPEGAYLTDLGSTNGTYVDGKAISEVPLDDKSEFVVGSTSIMLIISSE